MKQNIITLIFLVFTSNLFSQNTLSTAIDLGFKSSSFEYIDTQNTLYFTDDYSGQSTNDVFYKFTLTRSMNIIITHCGSELEDTYLHLLNSYGGLIEENDDPWDDVCENSLQSYLEITDMQPGTYYIVCEGYWEDGNITTTIEGIRPVEATSEFGGIDPSTGLNYILTITPTVPMSSVTNVGTDHSLQTIQYYDGLGRPFQTVQRNIAPGNEDLITMTEYDPVGRVEKVWVPVPVSDNQGASVDANYLSNISNSFNSDDKAFQLTVYEESPLNRVSEQYGLGSDWQNLNKKVSTVYATNTASEVSYYYVNETNNLQKNGTYAANTLYKTVSIDEDGKSNTEYKDKLGRTVLVRNANDVDTYYVYNDLDQKCFVLPPLACDGLGANSDYDDSNDKLLKYAYLYKYDERGNCIKKRLPGCDWIEMVYDKADRLILSQDGNQRVKTPKQWTVNKYDDFGRLIMSGLVNDNDISTEINTIKLNVITGNDDESNFLSMKDSNNKLFENEITFLTINYYDDYSFIGRQTSSEQSNLSYLAPPSSEYNQQYDGVGEQSKAKGLLTGTRTYILDNVINQYLLSAYYYDHKGQIVQSRSSNHLGGFDIVYNGYDFSGHLTKSQHTQSVQYKSPVTEITTNEYDHAGRLISTKHQVGANDNIEIAHYNYDELGRLKEKKRHNNSDTELFEYNIRNWPTKITSGTFVEDLYYNKNLPSQATACYNGNIAYIKYKSGGGNSKAYTHTYDNLNRLLNSTGYSVSSSGTMSVYGYDENLNYDKMGNVNFLQRKTSSTLRDYLGFSYIGNQISSVYDYVGQINVYDIKEYNNNNTSGYDFQYDQNGNMTVDKDRKIVAIKYNLLNLPDVVQFSNGNQIKNRYSADGRKLGSEYFTQLTTIQPLAEGTILNQVYQANVVDQTGTAYVGNYEYKTYWNVPYYITLKKVFNSEGYVDEYSNNQSYSGYVYFRKDHLGNNREVWRAGKPGGASATTLQRTWYYPSGLPWNYTTGTGASVQSYKYNSKEFIEMHGFDTYDYSARMMYPALGGRFMTIDPMAEKYFSISPYAYCGGNPVNRIDPDGRFPVWAAIGATLDYGLQVYDNYQNGSSGYDAWVGNVNFVSVGLSGINPTGKLKILKTITLEVVKAATENSTVNDGLLLNTDVKDVATKAAVNTAVDVGVGKLIDAGSSKSLQNANKEVSETNKQVKTAQRQAERSPNSSKKAENVNTAQSNAQTARNKQVRTQMLNSTVGQTPNTTQQAVKVTTNSMQEDEERR